MTQADTAGGPSTTAPEAVHISRSLVAPPTLVWRALTDPNALTAWFWPARLAPRVAAEAIVGGQLRITSAVARSMSAAVRGEYLTVTEPTLLELRWRFEGDQDDTRVSLRLAEADDGGTELTVEHDGFTDEEDRDAARRTWRGCLDRLPDWLHAASG